MDTIKKDYSTVKKTKYEHSSGGIIYRVENNEVQFLLLRDRNNNWSFPKGWIEEGEDEITAAKREIEEEVGITSVELVAKIDTNKYWYKFEGVVIRKEVEFYLFKFTGSEVPKPQKEEGIQEIQWVEKEKALEIIGYPKSNKPLLEKAIAIVTK